MYVVVWEVYSLSHVFPTEASKHNTHVKQSFKLASDTETDYIEIDVDVGLYLFSTFEYPVIDFQSIFDSNNYQQINLEMILDAFLLPRRSPDAFQTTAALFGTA